MWEALAEAIRRGDMAAAFGIGISIAFGVLGFAIRTLWNTNQSLHRELGALEKTCRDELDEVHEKRLQEAKEVTETIITFTTDLNKAMDRLSITMETLLSLQKTPFGCPIEERKK